MDPNKSIGQPAGERMLRPTSTDITKPHSTKTPKQTTKPSITASQHLITTTAQQHNTTTPKYNTTARHNTAKPPHTRPEHKVTMSNENRACMRHTCKGSNNQPKDSDELCATDGESAELGAILSQIRLAQSSLHFYATLYIKSLYIHLCSLYISTCIFSLHKYVLYKCHLYVLFIINLLHLYSIHIYMLSTFYAPLHSYALYIYMVPWFIFLFNCIHSGNHFTHIACIIVGLLFLLQRFLCCFVFVFYESRIIVS